MKKFTENISNNSIWQTKTPTSISDTLPVTVIEAGHFYANIDYNVNRKYHNSFLMLYTVSGSGLIKYMGNEFVLYEKEAIIIDCTEPHMYESCSENWDFLWLHFTGNSAKGIYNYLYPETVNKIQVYNSSDFAASFNKIIDDTILSDPIHCYSVSCELQNMILVLSKDLTQKDNGSKKNLDIVLQKAMDFMDNNLAKNISIKELSDSINVSEYHFIRLFKKATGISPYNYLIGLRIAKAKRMLVETNDSIENISVSCGFNDTANFINKFKKLTGETPLKYRKAFK